MGWPWQQGRVHGTEYRCLHCFRGVADPCLLAITQALAENKQGSLSPHPPGESESDRSARCKILKERQETRTGVSGSHRHGRCRSQTSTPSSGDRRRRCVLHSRPRTPPTRPPKRYRSLPFLHQTPAMDWSSPWICFFPSS